MTPRTRVCEISCSYWLRDPRVRREAEALADAGWDVEVLCLRAPDEAAASEHGNVHIQRLPLRHKRGSQLRYLLEYAAFLALASAQLTRAHLHRRYDLVHIHNMPEALVFCAWLPKLTRTPIVLDVHDPMPEIYRARFEIAETHWLSRLLLWQERASFAFADQIITPHERVSSLHTRSAPAAKITAVMNVPDPKVFTSNSIAEGAPHARFTLIYTGTVSPPYGLDTVIHAVAQLRRSIPGICFRIVGEGDSLTVLQQLVAELELNAHVEFLPAVSVDQIPALLATADIAVCPHRRDDVTDWLFSTKLVEALRVGLPVIAARSQTLMDYFDDSMVAYVEPDNAAEFAAQVERLYRDPLLGRQMVRCADKFFAAHAWEHERARLYEVIERTQPTAPRNPSRRRSIHQPD